MNPPDGGPAPRLNALRAGVLGANDGIVSTAGLVVGVAGATTSTTAVLTAGLAGVLAGAVSMALGEYVSVSTQRDSERAQLEQEREELASSPEAELAELARIYEAKGLSRPTAVRVAEELTDHDALTAHADAELRLDPEQLTNPWHAAVASALAFTAGAALPLAAILLGPPGTRVPLTVVTVLLALALTGGLSARLGGARPRAAVVRLVVGGGLGLGLTYAVGRLLGVAAT